RLRQLRAPPLVGGGGQLTGELFARQLERLERADALGIAHGFDRRPGTLALELVPPLLNPIVRVDQAFTGITHTHNIIVRSRLDYRLTTVPFFTCSSAP